MTASTDFTDQTHLFRGPLPSGLGVPAEDPGLPLAAAPEVPWLQPEPEALLAADGDDPARAVAARAGIRLGSGRC
jgi:RNA polymerase sigma-70 factor (ECF subfamily)